MSGARGDELRRWPCPHGCGPWLGPVEHDHGAVGRRCRKCGEFARYPLSTDPARRAAEMAAAREARREQAAPARPQAEVAPAVTWHGLAETFLAALEREERQLAVDARRAREAGFVEFARAVEQLRVRVHAMRGDMAALLSATTAR